MDGNRFDAWTRSWTTARTRRGVVRGLAAGALGAAAAALGVRPAAPQSCLNAACNADSECCAGTNCLLGICNACVPFAGACNATRPCCREDPTTCCGGLCVDTRTNENHCGRCDNVCDRLSTCSNGLCCLRGRVNRNGICCRFTEQNCGGQCKNLQTDPANCGRCGVACASNKICSKGKCCGKGLINCGGRCVNLKTNPDNCGRCGKRCPSRRCVNRQCTKPEA